MILQTQQGIAPVTRHNPTLQKIAKGSKTGVAGISDNVVENFDFQKLTCADEITRVLMASLFLQFTRSTILPSKELVRYHPS